MDPSNEGMQKKCNSTTKSPWIINNQDNNVEVPHALDIIDINLWIKDTSTNIYADIYADKASLI